MAQHCANCSSENSDTAKFCLECGKPLARACPACGVPAAAGKFCAECGSPLAAAPGSASPTTPAVSGAREPVSERRTTTVLFGDLVSFTTLSASRDPEEVRELLSAYFAVARTVVGRYGGTIEKFIGDAVMAVWGVPLSHEDDAERAVRAGLDLVSEVAALGEETGAPGLAMRVGIVTGSVAVTLGATNEGMVAGDAVNTAARVQTAAEPGTVWVDVETRGLTQAAVAFSDMGEHTLKGKAEPARLFRADSIVASRGGAHRVDGLQAPFTGRDAELRRVKELVHLTQSDGRARLVILSGVAGIGKSRLVWELEKYADGLTDGFFWHRGRCLSYGDGVAFWAFAEMIRQRLRILEDDDRTVADQRVRAGVEKVAATPDEAAWLTPRVAALVSGDQGVVFDRIDLFSAWATFLERVGGSSPVVLVFDDMQHADSGLLDLVQHLLQTIRCKLMVVVLTRPELLERCPSLLAGRATTRMDLMPLSEDSMRVLVDALVADLPGRARAALVQRAEGVPLYAVETVRSLIDQGAVVAQEGRYAFVDHDHSRVDLRGLSAPTSLQTLIAARLDTLAPQERRVVQDASVLGMTFPYATLAALASTSSHELDQALEALLAKDILATEEGPRTPELGQFRFRQAMVREIAYGTLARSDRRTRHLAAAAHLTPAEDDVPDALAGIIAQHLLDALAASSDRDPDRPDLATRARKLLTQAAVRAESLGSPDAALARVLAAIPLDPDPLELAQLQERGARVARLSGQSQLGEELAAQAVVGYEALGRTASVVDALYQQTAALSELGRMQESRDCALRGSALARECDGVSAEAHLGLLSELAWSDRWRGDREAQLGHALERVKVAEGLRNPEGLLSAMSGLSVVLGDCGLVTAKRAVLQHCTTAARDEHRLNALALSLTNLLEATYPEELTQSGELADELITVRQHLGSRYRASVALANACWAWQLSGDWDRLTAETSAFLEDEEFSSVDTAVWLPRALAVVARGEAVELQDWPSSEDPSFQHFGELAQALSLAQQGDAAAAAECAADSARRAHAAEGVVEDLHAVWTIPVELQLAAGDVEAAEELFRLASPLVSDLPPALTRGQLPRLRGMVAAARGENPEADLREAEAALAAYAAPYLVARTRLELGRWLHGQGRPQESTPLLAQARETFVELRAAPSIAEVDDVLVASEPTQV